MFVASLAAYLRSTNVTTYMTLDVPTIVGPAFDRALRVYSIREGEGIRIAGPAPRAEELLTGLARPLTFAHQSDGGQ